MALKRTLPRKQRHKTLELYISPVLNLFIVLIPFLLLTTVFVQTSVIDLSLPSTPDEKNLFTETPNEISKEKLLILCIADQGFYIILEDKLLNKIPKENNYNFDNLEKFLNITAFLYNIIHHFY